MGFDHTDPQDPQDPVTQQQIRGLLIFSDFS